MVRLIIVILIIYFYVPNVYGKSELLILHNNDMRCKIEEKVDSGQSFGGIARVSHVVRKAREAALEKKGPPVVYLNAGDIYTDPVWQNPFAKRVAIEIMNNLKPDVACLGYHDLNQDVGYIRSFIARLKFPIIAANVHFKNASFLTNFIKPSIVLDVNNTKIGVVGYVTPLLQIIASNSGIYLEDEVTALQRECAQLKRLKVQIIIALGYSGFDMDLKIAEVVKDVDVVIGGLTNTFLWNGPPPRSEKSRGPYPTQVIQKSGKKVMVLSTYGFTRYMGQLKVTFDDDGTLSYEGNPMFLNEDVPPDIDTLRLIDTYRATIRDVQGDDVVLGRTSVYMDADNVRYDESNFGNFVADAFVEHIAQRRAYVYWTDAPIAFINAGSIRMSLNTSKENPNITVGMLTEAMPFHQLLCIVDLLGETLLKILEHAVMSNGETRGGEFLQLSGIYVSFNITKRAYKRVVLAKVFCTKCEYPILEYVDPNARYKVIMNAFLSNGGDGYAGFMNETIKRESINAFATDIVAQSMRFHGNIRPECEDRISYVSPTTRFQNMHLRNGFTGKEYSFTYIFFSFTLLYTLY